MILIIDNYDSFTFNLRQALAALTDLPIEVVRNDAISLDALATLSLTHLVISPGPRTPLDSGISVAAVQKFSGRVPLLGVCLGHQCIAHAAGARVVRAGRLVHGKTTMIAHDGAGLFAGLPNPFPAARYHSLLIDPATLPAEWTPCAWSQDAPNELMGLRHRDAPTFGVQFHPESFMTPDGSKLLANFLRFA